MILRKNQMIRPKNFPIPRWEIRNSSEEFRISSVEIYESQ